MIEDSDEQLSDDSEEDEGSTECCILGVVQNASCCVRSNLKERVRWMQCVSPPPSLFVQSLQKT